MQTQRSSRQFLSQWSWKLIILFLAVASGTIGFTATSMLLKQPQTPNCNRVMWIFASAAKRLYCAQTEAKQETVESLLEAIALVEALPSNHTVRPEVDRQVAEWTEKILDLAEAKFQAGNLKAAESIVGEIPKKIAAYEQVQQKRQRWQNTWTKAEELYEEAEAHLRAGRWNLAFEQAVKLTYVENDYWSNQKYQETVDKIRIAREESAKLDSVYVQLQDGGIDNWLEVIRKAGAIKSNSYVYQEAQNLVEQAQAKLVEQIEQYIQNNNWSDLLYVTNRLPAQLDWGEEVRDWQILGSAGSSADIGTVASLEAAIVEAEKIEESSKLYNKSERLIERWQLEIGDIAILTKARQLATMGGISDLRAAVGEANLVPKSNPRYTEARELIAEWTNTIQTQEDQPILDRARRLSYGNNVSAWRAAITEASLIRPNRPLYNQAQRQIGRWRANIQRVEDQPILDQADRLAQRQNWQGAIAVAQQIERGRALYPDAQAKIDRWQQEIRGEELMQQAYQVASNRNPSSLLEAIKLMQNIPRSSRLQAEGLEQANRWSAEILAIAQNRARVSVKQAIAIAETIPPGTSSYRQAQNLISSWTEQLKPPLTLPEIRPIQEVLYEESTSRQ